MKDVDKEKAIKRYNKAIRYLNENATFEFTLMLYEDVICQSLAISAGLVKNIKNEIK